MLITYPVRVVPKESPNLQSRVYPYISINLKKSSVVNTIPSPPRKYSIVIG